MHTDIKLQGVNFCPKSPHSQNLIQFKELIEKKN